MALTDKQAAFVREYVQDFNGTQAAIRAGYAPDSARQQASKNLSKPDIQEAITQFRAEADSAAVATLQECLEALTEIIRASLPHTMDDQGRVILERLRDYPRALQEITTRVDIGEDTAATITKYKLRDPIAAIERLAKLMGWDAPEKREITEAGPFRLVVLPPGSTAPPDD